MKCPVCGNNTFDNINYEFEICEQCFWEYDKFQVDNPDYAGGANNHSLNDYRKIYLSLLKDNPEFNCRNKADSELIVAIDNGEIEWKG